MAAPTFVQEYESAWNSNTTPKTSSVSVNNGDVLVVVGIVADFGDTLGTPTGGGLTYALSTQAGSANFTHVYVWTATAASTQTFTLSVTRVGGGGQFWGFNCLRFSGTTGVGAVATTTSASGAPSLGITSTLANSAVVVGNGDWNAVDGTSRTWRTAGVIATEQSYFRDASWYAIYVGYHSDVGSIGAKTVGLSAPGAQKFSIAAVEVKGTASGINVNVGQAVETDTATAVARRKSKTLGQATETDTATAVGRLKSKTIGQASETDTATAIARKKSKAVGQAVETDTARSVSVGTAGIVVMLGQAVETDTARAISRKKSKTVGQAVETDTAFPITVLVQLTIWLLVPPTITEKYPIRGSLQYSQHRPLTVFGDDTNLYTSDEGSIRVGGDDAGAIPFGTKYIWFGGHVNTTDSQAIRDLWLAHGFGVEDIHV